MRVSQGVSEPYVPGHSSPPVFRLDNGSVCGRRYRDDGWIGRARSDLATHLVPRRRGEAHGPAIGADSCADSAAAAATTAARRFTFAQWNLVSCSPPTPLHPSHGLTETFV